jgi:MtrB/PioB family decaheme-associated outer membrane protein
MRIEVRHLSGTVAAVALLSVAGFMATSEAMAQKATVADTPSSVATVNSEDIKALPDVWWFHGVVEAGGRFFVNNPQDHHQTANAPAGTPGTKGKSLGNFYEYRDLKPGAIGNFWMATGSRDGLYEVDIGGKNVGYDDQRYYFDYSKAGEQYFNFDWDQTPHVYSRSALSPYYVSGSAVVLVPGAAGHTTVPTIAPYAQPLDIGIRRDTASAQYRWTPDTAWDIKANYSHMSRTGSQVSAVYNSTRGGPWTIGLIQLPKPVDDTTQNYGVNGEYVGTSLWGQRIVFKAGYKGSKYTDSFDSYTIENPATGAPGTRISTWPSNRANGFDATLAADLPWMSRYAGTISYTKMTQDDAFIPASFTAAYMPPAPSLNGEVDTLLSNNIVTTKITPELTSKFSYRYYDFDNKTPELYFPGVPVNDGGSVNVNSISMGYTKQNIGEQLDWRPSREWNLGAAYGFERYDWTRADVNVTNEHSGKIFADWKPSSWFGLRSSGYYANRHYENYDYWGYVGSFQWPDGGGDQYQSSYRQLMIDNRKTWKANVSADIVVVDGVTVTPTFKYENANYDVDPLTQQGLDESRKWTGGVDATYLINPDTSVMVGYMYEFGKQRLYGTDCTGNPCSGGSGPGGSGAQTLTNDTTVVHTFTALLRYAAIPDKLNTSVRYTASHGFDKLDFIAASGGAFPEDTTWFQRVDAIATYKFDKEQVARLGWAGDVKATLHYAWEQNAASNWANDPLTPYTFLTGPNSSVNSRLWLSWYNPNYNVQMLIGSLAFSW